VGVENFRGNREVKGEAMRYYITKEDLHINYNLTGVKDE